MEFGDSVNKCQRFLLQLYILFSHKRKEFGKHKLLVSYNHPIGDVTTHLQFSREKHRFYVLAPVFHLTFLRVDSWSGAKMVLRFRRKL